MFDRFLLFAVFSFVVFFYDINGNEFLDNKSLQRIKSCRRKIGVQQLQNCSETSVRAWNLDQRDSFQLVLNLESICCSQWQTHDCRLALAKEHCDALEYHVMSFRMEKIRIMNQRTICSDYRYHDYDCQHPDIQTAHKQVDQQIR